VCGGPGLRRGRRGRFLLPYMTFAGDPIACSAIGRCIDAIGGAGWKHWLRVRQCRSSSWTAPRHRTLCCWRWRFRRPDRVVGIGFPVYTGPPPDTKWPAVPVPLAFPQTPYPVSFRSHVVCTSSTSQIRASARPGVHP
jgi:hypothetical protein